MGKKARVHRDLEVYQYDEILAILVGMIINPQTWIIPPQNKGVSEEPSDYNEFL